MDLKQLGKGEETKDKDDENEDFMQNVEQSNSKDEVDSLNRVSLVGDVGADDKIS